jgi:uridine monophosphate synthetase
MFKFMNKLTLLISALLFTQTATPISMGNALDDVYKIYSQEERQLILELHEIGVLRFDTDKINCPLASPYYIDLRHIMSYPQIFKKVIYMLQTKTSNLNYDLICGVPYAALAMASNVAFCTNTPLIMRRSHIKNYGTGRKIEGHFQAKQRCLVFEDVVTTASSLIETVKDLEEAQLQVSDCIVLFDREQGGVEWMRNQGYQVHTLFTITDFMNILSEEGKIDPKLATEILSWTQQNQVAGVNWKATAC